MFLTTTFYPLYTNEKLQCFPSLILSSIRANSVFTYTFNINTKSRINRTSLTCVESQLFLRDILLCHQNNMIFQRVEFFRYKEKNFNVMLRN